MKANLLQMEVRSIKDMTVAKAKAIVDFMQTEVARGNADNKLANGFGKERITISDLCRCTSNLESSNIHTATAATSLTKANEITTVKFSNWEGESIGTETKAFVNDILKQFLADPVDGEKCAGAAIVTHTIRPDLLEASMDRYKHMKYHVNLSINIPLSILASTKLTSSLWVARCTGFLCWIPARATRSS